jgi:AraC-like DNA-binding protein
MAEGATVAFSDPDSYAVGFGDVSVKLTITAAGVFKAQLTRLKLNDLEIYRCHENLPRIAYLSFPPDRIFLSFAIGAGSLLSDGLALRDGDAVLHGVGDHTHQRSSGACQWGLISIPSAQFARFGKVLTGQDTVGPQAIGIVHPARAETLRFQRLFRQACRLAGPKRKPIERHEAARALEQHLLHAIMNFASAIETDQRSEPHAAIMVRLEETLSRRMDRKLTVTALSAEIGVPERTLRMCCTEFLAVSPMRYIMLQRLNAARAALRRADPSTTSVAEVARNHQFLELGRFAVTYRTTFGESPSTTLQQNPHTCVKDAEIA